MKSSLFFTLTEASFPEEKEGYITEQINMGISRKSESAITKDSHATGKIKYSDLTEEEKKVCDDFISIIKSKVKFIE